MIFSLEFSSPFQSDIFNLSSFLRHPSHYLYKYFHLSIISQRDSHKCWKFYFILQIYSHLYFPFPYHFWYHLGKLPNFTSNIHFVMQNALSLHCSFYTCLMLLHTCSRGSIVSQGMCVRDTEGGRTTIIAIVVGYLFCTQAWQNHSVLTASSGLFQSVLSWWLPLIPQM